MADTERAMGERLAIVETWIGQHEKACSERWGQVRTIMLVGLTALIGITGWGLKTVFDGQQQQLAVLRQVAAQPAHP